MIGIGFAGFVTLLVLGFISSITLYVYTFLRHRVLAAWEGFFSAWILAWLGGWVGSPVFGHWGPHIAGLFVVPALLGAFSAPFLAVSALRALSVTLPTPRSETEFSQTGAAPQVEMRKAS
jgi:hypothetical protein